MRRGLSAVCKRWEVILRLFVGIDWGSKSHAVCVLDAQGKKLLEREVRHHGDDVRDFVVKLRALAGDDMSVVSAAMEAPQGVMVEALLECGAKVYSINPKQLDRFRDRHSVSGAKDDPLDAYVLATSLQTDPGLFRAISLPSPEMMRLSALSRSYEAMTEQVLSLSNQIREQLRRYYPQMLELGDWHDEPWLWLLFEAAPTPKAAAKLSLLKISNILTAKRIRRISAKQVRDKL